MSPAWASAVAGCKPGDTKQTQKEETALEPYLAHHKTPHGLQPHSTFAVSAMHTKAHDHTHVLRPRKTLSRDCFFNNWPWLFLVSAPVSPKPIPTFTSPVSSSSYSYGTKLTKLPILLPWQYDKEIGACWCRLTVVWCCSYGVLCDSSVTANLWWGILHTNRHGAQLLRRVPSGTVGSCDALQSIWCVCCRSHKQLTFWIGKYLIYFFQESNISSGFPGINFTIPTSVWKYYIIKFTSVCKKLQVNVLTSQLS